MANKLVSQLHHVEIFTSTPDETVGFFKDMLGLQESAREGQSVYLRAWGEWFHHSLKVTEGRGPGLGHAAWRTYGSDELEEAAKRLTDAGIEGRWIDGDVGHGRAFQFWQPGGHLFELVWDCERYVAPPELKSAYPNRPQKQVTTGGPVRRLDHVTVTSAQLLEDAAVFRDQLGFRIMEGIGTPDAQFFNFLTSGAQNHDLGIAIELPGDPSVKPGRYSHLCYYYDTREDLLRALDILGEGGHRLIYGPTKHGIGELFLAYLYEPGGNVVELQTGGYWNYIPDWETIWFSIQDGPNTAWHETQLPTPQTRPPATANPPENSTSPSDQYTAREREDELVAK